MKTYILVKNTVPLGFAMVGVAHASLAMYLKYKDTPDMEDYLKSFKKVVCKVSEEEFEVAKGYKDNIVITESALGKEETVIAFSPRATWTSVFKTYKLYK